MSGEDDCCDNSSNSHFHVSNFLNIHDSDDDNDIDTHKSINCIVVIASMNFAAIRSYINSSSCSTVVVIVV